MGRAATKGFLAQVTVGAELQDMRVVRRGWRLLAFELDRHDAAVFESDNVVGFANQVEFSVEEWFR